MALNDITIAKRLSMKRLDDYIHMYSHIYNIVVVVVM